MGAIKAICDERRKHDQVPHSVHSEIAQLALGAAPLALTATRLGVETLYDRKAVAALAELEAQIATKQGEVDAAVAEFEGPSEAAAVAASVSRPVGESKAARSCIIDAECFILPLGGGWAC